MMRPLLLLLVLSSPLNAAEVVNWSRLEGRVKQTDGKRSTITIQNRDSDIFTVRVDGDCLIVRRKEEVPLKDVQYDDKVVLLNVPKTPAAKEADEPPAGEVYRPLR